MSEASLRAEIAALRERVKASETAMARAAVNHDKIKQWIRDNLGTDLSLVQALIAQEAPSAKAIKSEVKKQVEKRTAEVRKELRKELKKELAAQREHYEQQLAALRTEMTAAPGALSAAAPTKRATTVDTVDTVDTITTPFGESFDLSDSVAPAAASAIASKSNKSSKPSMFDDLLGSSDDELGALFGGGSNRNGGSKGKATGKSKKAKTIKTQKSPSAKKAALLFDELADGDDGDEDGDDVFGREVDESGVGNESAAVEADDGRPPAHIVRKALGLDQVGDDEWSDEEVEVETLRLVLTNNQQLRSLEDLAMKRPARRLFRNAEDMDTLSRANSVALKDAIYFYGANEYGFVAGQVRKLAARGARVLFHPNTVDSAWSFGVRDTDKLFPVCRDGLGASQVLFHVLSGVKRWLGVAEGCEPPHGSIEGLDPYPALLDGQQATEEARLEAIRSDQYAPRAKASAGVQKAFKHSFGTGHVPRYGEPMAASLKHGLVYTKTNKTRWRAVDTNLLKMREYFDLYYYFAKKATENQRFIFVVCGDALPVFMARLLENNPKTLTNVWIIALPFEHLGGNSAAVNNRLARLPPKTPPILASAQLHEELYRQYAKIFRPLLTRKL